MGKVYAIIAMIILAALGADAQFRVTATVVDSTGVGEAFATVRVYPAVNAEKTAAIGTSDIDGIIDQKLPQAGDYTITVSSVGKQPLTRDFQVTAQNPVAALGTIVIHPSATSLAEVEVVAQKPLVTAEVDRLSYDVQADEDSRTNTVLEMLRKVPLVTVDGEDNIKVKGSSNFKIYKNGRPNTAFSNNAKEVLSAIPASMIKRIEVITEPGAKYDAEGVGGILNIVTIDNSAVNGVLGNLSASINNNAALNANGYLTTQIDKVTASVNYGYMGMTSSSTKNMGETLMNYTQTGESYTTASRGKNPGAVQYMQLEASYEPDTLNLVTMAFGGYFYNIKPEGEGNARYLDADGALLYSMKSSYYFPKYDYYDFNGKIDYQRLTRHKGESIVFSYLMSTTTDKTNQLTSYTDLYNVPFSYTSMDVNKSLRFWEHTFQLDYTRPFGTAHKLNLGAKYIFRNNRSNQLQRFDNGLSDPSDFTHNTNVGALYAEYYFNAGPVDMRAGVRYEYSYLGAKFKDGSNPDFSQHLNDFVPTAGINWRINPFNSLKFSFSTRINRPGISYLNPAVVESPLTRQFGNPDLSSATTRSLGLGYMLMKQKLMLNINLTYDFCNDGISNITYTEGQTIVSTYGNIAHSRRLSLDGYVQWQITPKTSLMVNAWGGYGKISNSSLALSNSRWQWGFYSQLTQQLPWKLRLQLAGMHYDSEVSDLYTIGGSMNSYGITLSRSFLKDDRLTVRVLAQNAFSPKWLDYKSRTINGDITGHNITKFQQRRFQLTLSWRFGSLNAQVKRTSATIENDDIVGGATRSASSEN